MKRAAVLLSVAVCICVSSRAALAQSPPIPHLGLQPFTTTNSITKDQQPPDVWDTPAAAPNGFTPIQVPAGATMWIAFNNNFDIHRKKNCVLTITTSDITIPITQPTGFPDAAHPNKTIKVKEEPGIGAGTAASPRTVGYWFDPQPAWERFRVVNTNPTAALNLTIECDTFCYDMTVDVADVRRIHCDDCGIETSTAEAMENPVHATQIWMFPESVPIDVSAPTSFVPPPGSGSWGSGFVFYDPYGNPRPNGGFACGTSGPGIPVDTPFDISFAMNAPMADQRYTLFYFDADGGSYVKHTLVPPDSSPVAYCTAKTNSLGCSPSIGWVGTPTAGANSGFVITGAQVQNNKFGLLFYATNGARAALPFQGGTMCMALPVNRTPLVNSGGTASPANDCSGMFWLDFNTFSTGGGGGSPNPALSVAGTLVNAQWWGRDPGFAPPNNTTLSDALEFFVEP